MNPATGFIAVDIHICGACRKQFSEVDEFVQHKKNGCPVLLSLQQSGIQSDVSQPNSVSGGNQITQIGSNRFTIPLPSVQVHDETGNHQRKDTSQAPVVENQFQVQQVSSTEEIGPYDHVTGTGHQTIQGGEYTDFEGATEGLQQPLGHEYVRTQHRRNKYYLQPPDSQTAQQQSSESAEASSTDSLIGSQMVISQFQSVEPEYVLQQVNQSEEVYDGRLAQLEGQTSIPPEPVYTLETHEEPPGNKSEEPLQGSYGEPNNGRGQNQMTNQSHHDNDVSGVNRTLSFEGQLPATFSLHSSGAGGKVFQQTAGPAYITNDVASSDIDAQVPYILNETTPANSHPSSQGEISHNTVASRLVTSDKSPPTRHDVLSKILTRPVERKEVDQFQQEKSPKKVLSKEPKTSGTKTAPEKKFPCNFEDCTYRTAYMKDLERHYRIHTGEKPFSCTQCGKTFNRNDKLILHMRYHTGDKSFKCQLCDYSCVESGSLKKHMRVHTEERPFKCQVCPYSSRSSGQLQIHLRIHTGDKPYICVTCNASFKVTSDLKRHMRIHTGEKPYSCDQCDYRCSVKGNLKSHMRVNHSEKHEIVCHSCDFKSSSKKALREHFKLHDTNSELTCNVCSYQCASKSALKNHMLRHNNSEDSLVKCNYCDYKTRQVGNVMSHMKRKHPSRVYHRKKIGRLYRKQNKGHVPYDEESASIEPISSKAKARCKKMFKCSICDSSFVREDSLKCHVKQHRDLSKSSLSTAYAVLKLQQPVLNLGKHDDDNQNLPETVDLTEPYIPAGARAENQMQPHFDASNIRTCQGQTEATRSQSLASSLGIKDILAAAGFNNSNGLKDTSPKASSSSVLAVSNNSDIQKEECIQANLFPGITITQSPQDVPTVQVMQNISLPYIRLPNGQILVLGQSPLSQAATVPEMSPRKTVTDVPQETQADLHYPVTLQQVQTIPIPQQISAPVSSSQPGAIPIQIIVPSDSQHSLPLVAQLLNSSLNTGQNLSVKQVDQENSSEIAQNYVVHIPGNPGNVIQTSGPSEEIQSQSYVLQIPVSGSNYGRSTPDLQQNSVGQVSGQAEQMSEVQNSENDILNS